MFMVLRALPVLFFFLLANGAYAQAVPSCGCEEIPGEDALPTLCVPPSSETAAPSVPDSVILLQVPAGPGLRVAIAQKVPNARARPGVCGENTETGYAFPHGGSPPGKGVTGRGTSIPPVPRQ